MDEEHELDELEEVEFHRGDTIRVTAHGQTRTGIVNTASNWGAPGDPDWYIEFTSPYTGAHYVKQKLDQAQIVLVEKAQDEDE